VAGTPSGLGKPLVLIALADGSYSALDATCTHQGCKTTFAAEKGQLSCPCHGSTFTPTGAVTAAPATKPLTSFATVKDSSGVTVTVA
jgi:cytochrome b6-f complex iron-sulfur subunit